MSNIRVVGVNEEVAQEAPEQPIEQATEQPPEQPTEQPIEEPAQQDIKNDVVESNNEEVKPKRLTQKDKIQCPKCLKEVSIKTYRYSHEKICQGQITEKPVKAQSKPKAKAKTKPQPIHEEVEEVEEPPRQIPPWKNKPAPQPLQPVNSLTQHYQLLQNEYIKQKQQKYSALCQNMFATKTKKK